MKKNVNYIRQNPDSKFFGLLVSDGWLKLSFVYKASDITGKGFGLALLEFKPKKAKVQGAQITALTQEVETLKLKVRRLENTRIDLEEDLVTIANADIPEDQAEILGPIKAQFLALLDKHGIEYDDQDDEDWEDDDDWEDEDDSLEDEEDTDE